MCILCKRPVKPPSPSYSRLFFLQTVAFGSLYNPLAENMWTPELSTDWIRDPSPQPLEIFHTLEPCAVMVEQESLDTKSRVYGCGKCLWMRERENFMGTKDTQTLPAGSVHSSPSHIHQTQTRPSENTIQSPVPALRSTPHSDLTLVWSCSAMETMCDVRCF